jgi:hypothetical protein
MYATAAEIGKIKKCPDCHTPCEVKEPKAGVATTATVTSALRPPGARDIPTSDVVASINTGAAEPMLSAEDDELLLRAPEAITVPPPKLPKLEDFDTEQEEEDDWSDETMHQEIRPFVTGVIGFLFQPGAATRCIAYAIGAAGLSAVAHVVIWIFKAGGALGQFTGVGGGVLILLPSLLFAVSLAVIYLTIIQETANGSDVVEGWPDMNFFDWALNARFVLVALAIAAGPGAILSTGLLMTLPWDNPLWFANVVVSVWMLFPWIILSMLGGASMASIYNPKVVQSIIRSRDGLLMFFIQSALVMLGVYLGMFAQYSTSLPLVAFGAAAAVALGFIYARLLGRLLWYSQASAAEKKAYATVPSKAVTAETSPNPANQQDWNKSPTA